MARCCLSPREAHHLRGRARPSAVRAREVKSRVTRHTRAQVNTLPSVQYRTLVWALFIYLSIYLFGHGSS